MRPGEAGRACAVPDSAHGWRSGGRFLASETPFWLRLPVCDELSSGSGVQLKVEPRRMSMRIAVTLALMVLCLALVPVIKTPRPNHDGP